MKKNRPIWDYLLHDRSNVKILLLILIIFGLIALAVGFFNLGIQAEAQYQQTIGY